MTQATQDKELLDEIVGYLSKADATTINIAWLEKVASEVRKYSAHMKEDDGVSGPSVQIWNGDFTSEWTCGVCGTYYPKDVFRRASARLWFSDISMGPEICSDCLGVGPLDAGKRARKHALIMRSEAHALEGFANSIEQFPAECWKSPEDLKRQYLIGNLLGRGAEIAFVKEAFTGRTTQELEMLFHQLTDEIPF